MTGISSNRGRLRLARLCALSSLFLGAAGQDVRPWFTEITDEIGLEFVHEASPDHEVGDEGDVSYFMPAVMGSGAALVDLDGDERLDIYLVQAAKNETGSENQSFFQSESGRFENVTETSGLGDKGYGMGVAAGDVNNDGRVDLFVTNYGVNALYVNDGDGRFAERSLDWNIAGARWSSSAVFCDYDLDGYLDLYIANYVRYDAAVPCSAHDGEADFCSPQVFPGEADRLYRNLGGGSFSDVSDDTGIARVAAPGLGVVCQDLTGDGWPDFYVANDGEANQLWVNQGNGRFVEDGFVAGVALNAFGREEAGMGIAIGDVDEDGDLDLFLTHLTSQTNTLYLNSGELGFEDETVLAGLGTVGLSMTGFGTAFLDMDHDGRLDIAVANGRVTRKTASRATEENDFWAAYGEPNQIFRNRLNGARLRFDEVTTRTIGPTDFSGPGEVGRGLATGDIDSDGDLDLLVTNTGGAARLYRNDAPKLGNWLIVRAYDPGTKRDLHGALVGVTVGGKRFVRVANPGSSYLSSSDPRAHFGLPEGTLEAIDVQWPGGRSESFAPPESLNRAITLSKGAGRMDSSERDR